MTKLETQRMAYLRGYNDATKAIDTIKWTRVEDRLPENNDEYLVCNKWGNIKMTHFLPFDKSFAEEDHPTHWMPLPAPPAV